MMIERVENVFDKMLKSIYDDSEIFSAIIREKSEIIPELRPFYDYSEELENDIKRVAAKVVANKIKEEKEFKTIGYKEFIENFSKYLTGGEIESLINNVMFMTTSELLEMCKIIRNNDKSKDKKYDKNIINILKCIVIRGGGNKKYWRDILEEVKNFEISNVNMMIEKKIGECLEC